MPKIYSEPELIVRFKCDRKLFSYKAYDELEENDIIKRLKKCSTPSYKYNGTVKAYTDNGEISNGSLKCHITSAGNYKLYNNMYYKYKHKEEEMYKIKKVTNPDEYHRWSAEIQRDDYINKHLEDFKVEVEYGNGYNELHYPLKIEL